MRTPRPGRLLKTPRPGYLFTTGECPNANHPKPMTGRCGLCGADVAAFRFGIRLAKVLIIGVPLALSLVVVLLILVGCTPKPTTPEERYLASVKDAATQNAVIWTDAVEEDALTLGHAVCEGLDAGKPMATIREETHQDDERSEAVIQAAVSAAAVYLCPQEG